MSRVRYFVSDVVYWMRAHEARRAPLVLAPRSSTLSSASARSPTTTPDPGPAPEVFVGQGVVPEEPADLGFPAFATRNTTRVSGADPSLRCRRRPCHVPRGGRVNGPTAVTIVPTDDWAAGIAAASLVGEPVGAPILMTTVAR